jgi:hypothetical protein
MEETGLRQSISDRIDQLHDRMEKEFGEGAGDQALSAYLGMLETVFGEDLEKVPPPFTRCVRMLPALNDDPLPVRLGVALFLYDFRPVIKMRRQDMLGGA